MLMGFTKVDRQGNYSKSDNERLSYGGMLQMRIIFVKGGFKALGKATTVAVRYSAVRRQFAENDGELERQVLDYRTQQYRLFPYLAATYAFAFTARSMSHMQTDFLESMQANRMDKINAMLPEIHSLSSGLKVIITQLASEGIEACRLCCGGHGYSKGSGLPDLYNTYVHMITAEGENYVLAQQTSRYLLKLYQQVLSGKEVQVASATYLNRAAEILNDRCAAQSDVDLEDVGVLLKAYQFRCVKLITKVAGQLQTDVGNGISPTEAWNNSLIEIYNISRAHSFYTLIVNFADGIKELRATGTDNSIIKVLSKLFALFGLYHIEKDFGEYGGYFNATQADQILLAVRRLLQEIRKDAVALVDAFDMTDYDLQSVLGRYDGNVYEALEAWVKSEPLNKKEVFDNYESTLGYWIKKQPPAKL
eukprot:TRINITY_DN10683_c0_g1_i2.p1 TRINITY_DN10683_c0_g1~~TRINITY_DN10683_c0_g1_i2.p1  ORF type:complete len:420 (-),score=126.29 TRINITY_DN10683_c0_g1_i2:34-1293(-)